MANDKPYLYLCLFILTSYCSCFWQFLKYPENTRKDRQRMGYVFEIINIPCIIIFALNMLVKMKLPYYKDGILMTDPKDIYKNYFKFMFILDIISVTTITAYEISWTVNDSEDIQKTISIVDLLFFVKIIEVFEINRLNRNVFQLHRKALATYNIIVLYSSILLISNIMACAFFSISLNSCTNQSVSPNGISCWVIQNKTAGKPILQNVWYVQYIYSLYWATTTMLGVGYGDITPLNSHEVVFTILAQYIACGIFAYSINEVWQIFTEMKEKQTRHQKQFNIINRYMRDRQVKSIVSNKVKAYLTHYYRYEKKGDKDKEMEIIDDLAPAIKEELLMETYGKLFKFKLFSRFSTELFESLVFKIQEMRYPDGEIIQSPQFEQIDPSIGYLFKGNIISQIQIGTKSKQLKSIEKQQIFGEYQFITTQITSIVLITNSYCSIYLLKNSKFLKHLQDQDYQQYFILKHSALQLNKLKYLIIECFFCGSEQHISENCCLTTIKQNSYSIIRSYRTTINLRADYRREKRRQVISIASKNECSAITRMIMKKWQQRAIDNSISSLNESVQENEFNFIESFVQTFTKPIISQQITTRGKSQMLQMNRFGMKNNKPRLSRAISMNDGEIDGNIKKESKQYLRSHLPFREVLVIESTVIDEIQEYQYYWKEFNMSNIVNQAHKRRGKKERRN